LKINEVFTVLPSSCLPEQLLDVQKDSSFALDLEKPKKTASIRRMRAESELLQRTLLEPATEKPKQTFITFSITNSTQYQAKIDLTQSNVSARYLLSRTPLDMKISAILLPGETKTFSIPAEEGEYPFTRYGAGIELLGCEANHTSHGLELPSADLREVNLEIYIGGVSPRHQGYKKRYVGDDCYFDWVEFNTVRWACIRFQK
jgi:hypothetical protein